MRNIIVSLNLISLFMAVSCLATDYYVNATTGVDSATCGSLTTAPCKTIKAAVGNRAAGNAVIKVAVGSYTEDVIYINVINPSTSDDVTIEGGWNSDFTSRSSNRALTMIHSGNKTSGYDVLFATWLSGTHQLTCTMRGFTIAYNNAGTIQSALYVHAEGMEKFTMENVRITGFPERALYFNSRNDSQCTINLHQTKIDRNMGATAVQFSSWHSSKMDVTITKSRVVENGSATGDHIGLDVHSSGSSIVEMTLENSIIAKNETEGLVAGVRLFSQDTSPQTVHIVNSTITENVAQGYSGVYLVSTDNSQLDITMRNTIVHENQATNSFTPEANLALAEFQSANLTFTGLYNIIGSHDILNGAPVYTSTHEIIQAPRLNTSYHLTAASPAIDTGQCGTKSIIYTRIAPYDDIDGDPRPGYGELSGCDIGADEFIPFPWPMFLPAITHQ